MNEKEISEIRRRFKPDKSNIAAVRGCYVNEKGEIVAEFNQSIALMQESEAEKFLSVLKRTLTGTPGKNLVDIEFTTQQVVQSEEHALLMALKNTALKDEDAIHAFFQRVISTISMEDNYLILLAQDSYDIPFRTRDGQQLDDASTDVFSYILCSICPVKQTKPALSYHVYENEFHSRMLEWIVSPPELGFMFPAFDDRSSNIYGALYYSRDIADNHADFIDTVFGCEAPMPAAEQKETFQSVLSEALAEDCNMEMVQNVHSQLKQMIELHKENKDPSPLRVSKSTVKQILHAGGAKQEQIEAFETEYNTHFGADTTLSPRNIVETKQIEVTTPDVKIHIGPGCDDLVETRMINGAKYILIRAEQGVEVNGVPIHIS